MFRVSRDPVRPKSPDPVRDLWDSSGLESDRTTGGGGVYGGGSSDPTRYRG